MFKLHQLIHKDLAKQGKHIRSTFRIGFSGRRKALPAVKACYRARHDVYWQGVELGNLHVREGLCRRTAMLMIFNLTSLWPQCMSAARERTLSAEPSPLFVVTIRMQKW